MSVNIYDKTNDELKAIAGGTLYADAPVGSILPYGGTTAPNGWLLCQGQPISRAIYSELFAVIGTAFGAGDSSTTFNVPDLRETVPVGVGNNNTPTNATHGKQLGVNYIIKAKQASIPTDFSSSMIGYLGQESNYNLYPWSHVKSEAGEDISQDITIERDGWYSIDYTLSNSSDMQNTFTLRDFDSQGEVHTIMRCVYDRSGTFRQTYLVPLKAGTYRYTHGGVGTLSVYMNRRDFA